MIFVGCQQMASILYATKGRNFMQGSSLLHVTTLPGLVAIGIVR